MSGLSLTGGTSLDEEALRLDGGGQLFTNDRVTREEFYYLIIVQLKTISCLTACFLELLLY